MLSFPPWRRMLREVLVCLVRVHVRLIAGVVGLIARGWGRDESSRLCVSTPCSNPFSIKPQLLEDTLFYWTHRLFHHPWLYATFHKTHHRFKVNDE